MLRKRKCKKIFPKNIFFYSFKKSTNLYKHFNFSKNIFDPNTAIVRSESGHIQHFDIIAHIW